MLLAELWAVSMASSDQAVSLCAVEVNSLVPNGSVAFQHTSDMSVDAARGGKGKSQADAWRFIGMAGQHSAFAAVWQPSGENAQTQVNDKQNADWAPSAAWWCGKQMWDRRGSLASVEAPPAELGQG